jgi:hypothetical protein
MPSTRTLDEVRSLLRIYNVGTGLDANYERGFARWASNVFEIGTEAAGTGTARTVKLKSANSVVLLTNSADSDFARLCFGGLSASFPALRRFGQVLQARFADDSGAAAIQHNDRVVANATGVSLTSADVGIVLTNEGATGEVNYTLPTAAANATYTFYCQDADGIKATAAAGDTIRIGASVSGTAGNVASTTIGSCIKLVAINATEWVAVSAVGTWVVT